MHLLNVKTLKLETFYDEEVPEYVILSHTWGKEEVTFAEIQNPNSPSTTGLAGVEKIRRTCDQATADGYSYAWVDTCCIDKSSSAELSEAINSMYRWYRNAEVCYAYLADVVQSNFEATFPKSRWFTRGWTLQELIAPPDVVFYDSKWNAIGTRGQHIVLISTITGIAADALDPGPDPLKYKFCIAERMSWAAKRQTTRVEDTAYCLMGIFGVNMPLLYGEGERAFIRLQHELMRTSNDDSILAWGQGLPTPEPPLLASGVSSLHDVNLWPSTLLAISPRDFENCGNVNHFPGSATSFVMTNSGLQIQLPLLNIPTQFVPRSRTYVGVLSCWSDRRGSALLGILIASASPIRQDMESTVNVRRISIVVADGSPAATLHISPRLAMGASTHRITISQTVLGGTLSHLNIRPTYLVLNCGQALDDGKFLVSRAWTRNYSRHGRDDDWDKTTKVLTLSDRRNVACFDFENELLSTAFAVVVVRNAAIACDRRSIEDNMRHHALRRPIDARQKERGLKLQDADGNKMLVKVNAKKNRANPSAHIYEVFVDLVPVDDGRTSEPMAIDS